MLLHRLVGRVGLFWQLLVPSVLAVVVAVAVVQVWTLQNGKAAVERQMERNLHTNLALLKSYLIPFGTEWSSEGGQLRLGQTTIASRPDIVDAASRVSGAAATIFSGDERVATSLLKADGTHAVGTRLADPVIRDMVLTEGKTYQGSTTILGQPYLTIYEPIRDGKGKVIGVLFSGMPIAEVLAAQHDLVVQATLVSIPALMLLIAVRTYLLKVTLKPLTKLAAATRSIAGGNLDTDVPGLQRHDQVGRLAQAVRIFREAVVEKRRIEEVSAAAREAAEAERLRAEADRTATEQAQAAVVASLATGLEHLAKGDLTFRLQEEFTSTYETLRTDFNAAMAQLQTMVKGIAANSEALRSGTEEIATAADDLSRRTEQQAATLEETAAALGEITATVGKTAEGAKLARDVVARTRAQAERSSEVVRGAVTAMGGIQESSRQIGQIIGVIDEIAFQTNLLALNAGVEAARAGDAGRGFAVVASEVRALAQRSAGAAREIKALISASASQVETGVKLVGETGQVLTAIASQVDEVNAAVSAIAASAVEQSTGLAEVNRAVNQMDQVTQQNAAMVEQSTAASHNLAQETAELVRMAERFRTGEPARPPSPPPEEPGRRSATVTRLAPVPPHRARREQAARKPAVREETWEEF